MEEQVDKLVERAWAKYQTIPPGERLLIGISGIPGSGKTTLAKTVTSRLNELSSLDGKTSMPLPASYIPMDGYHLSRAQLSSMPDPKLAHDRRGAHFTFDGQAFLNLIHSVRQPLTQDTKTIYAPSFDHAIKDPVQDDIPISATSRILLFEGNYLSLDLDPWKEAADLMDERWFVNVSEEVAGERLVKRHVAAGIAENEEAAWARVRENDLVNGREIVEKRVDVHEIVESRNDKAWK